MEKSPETRNSNRAKPLGVASLMVGEIGTCRCWLPHVGWLGVLLGAVGNALAISAITRHHRKTANTSYGIAGIVMSTLAVAAGLAFQIKHMGGALDWMILPIAPAVSYGVLGALTALCIAGLFAARTRALRIGTVIAAVSLAAFVYTAANAVTIADRAMTAGRAEPVASAIEPRP